METPPTEKTTSIECVDGTVRFPGTDGQETEYRYAFHLNDSKMRVWMEERKTKAQWMSEQLAIEDFAPTDGIIPGASVKVYFEKLARAMQTMATEDTGSGSKRELGFDAETCVLRLSITLTFTADDIRWEPAYEFKLMPVALQPMDVLAAKIEDLELEVETLKNQASEVTSGAVFARAKPTRRADDFDVEWVITESANGKRLSWITEEGCIIIPEDGVYTIVVELTGQCEHVGDDPVVTILDDKCEDLGVLRCCHSESILATHRLVACAYLKKGSDIEIEVSGDFEFDSDRSSLFIHLVR